MNKYLEQFRMVATTAQLQRFANASMKRGLDNAAWLADSEIIYRELEGE